MSIFFTILINLFVNFAFMIILDALSDAELVDLVRQPGSGHQRNRCSPN
jgi:hypothetical protein